MPKQARRFSLSLVFLLLLASCGGGGGNQSTTKSSTIKGKVLDDYIKNAKVVVDINRNGKCDDGEPYTYTDGNGTFKLTVSSKYANYPLVACINEGEQSEFSNGTPIEGRFAFHSLNGSILSPFSDITYGYLKEHPESTIEEAKKLIGTSLGISPEELDSDYVQENNKHLTRMGRAVGRLYSLVTKNQNLDYNFISKGISSYVRFHGAEILTNKNPDFSDINNVLSSVKSQSLLRRESYKPTWLIGKTLYSITENDNKAMLYKLTFGEGKNGDVKVHCSSINIKDINNSTDISSINGTCGDYDWGANLTWKTEGNELVVNDKQGGGKITKVTCYYPKSNSSNVTLTMGEIFEEWENDLRDLGAYNKTTLPVTFRLDNNSAICNIKILVHRENLGTMIPNLPDHICSPLPSHDIKDVEELVNYYSPYIGNAWKDPEYDTTLPKNIAGTIFKFDNSNDSGQLLLKSDNGTVVPYGKFWFKDYNGTKYLVMDRGPFNYGYSPTSPGEGRLLGIVKNFREYCVEDFLYQDVPESFNWYLGSVAKGIALKVKTELKN